MSKISKRTIIFAAYAIVGAVLIVLGMFGLIPDFFSGMGFSLMVIGIAQLIRIARYKTDESYAKKMEIMQTDERNVYLAHKARSIAFAWGLIATTVALIVFEAMQLKTYALLCSTVVCVFIAIYLCSWWILQKKG